MRVLASGGHNVNHLDELYDGEMPDILDNAFTIVEYESGVRAMLDLCMFAEATRNQEEISVVGDKGKVEALIPEDIVRIGIRGKHHIGDVAQFSLKTIPSPIKAYITGHLIGTSPIFARHTNRRRRRSESLGRLMVCGSWHRRPARH